MSESPSRAHLHTVTGQISHNLAGCTAASLLSDIPPWVLHLLSHPRSRPPSHSPPPNCSPMTRVPVRHASHQLQNVPRSRQSQSDHLQQVCTGAATPRTRLGAKARRCRPLSPAPARREGLLPSVSSAAGGSACNVSTEQQIGGAPTRSRPGSNRRTPNPSSPSNSDRRANERCTRPAVVFPITIHTAISSALLHSLKLFTHCPTGAPPPFRRLSAELP